MGAAGKDPQSTHPHRLYQSKYHCYIAYFEIFSLRVWKRSTWLCSTGSSREDRHLRCCCFFCLFLFCCCCLLSVGGPANLCDSVATECLPAAELCTLQQPSPHPSACSLPPCGSLRTCFPPLPPPGLQAKSSSFRTGPPVLNLLLLLRQSLSSATSNSTLSLSVSLLQGSL